jgi:hypothetical protein
MLRSDATEIFRCSLTRTPSQLENQEDRVVYPCVYHAQTVKAKKPQAVWSSDAFLAHSSICNDPAAKQKVQIDYQKKHVL